MKDYREAQKMVDVSLANPCA